MMSTQKNRRKTTDEGWSESLSRVVSLLLELAKGCSCPDVPGKQDGYGQELRAGGGSLPLKCELRRWRQKASAVENCAGELCLGLF